MAKRKSILVLVVVLSCASICFGQYSDGDGSPENPYQIATAEDMNQIGANPNDWDAHFVMVNDINLADYTGTQFNIIGYYESYKSPNNAPFTGVFDGNSHAISNFTYECTGTNGIGLFGYVYNPNAKIKDLTLSEPDVNVAGDSYYVGSLVGYLRNATITGCAIEDGSVSGYFYIGGLVGHNWGGTISNCYATGDVSGILRVGGLVGLGGTISNCYATGNVTGNYYVGGLVGENYGTIYNCYATGRVSGDGRVGGLVGGWGSIAINSFWDVNTSGQTSSASGEGKTTAEMQTESTFTGAGWDCIEIWNIGENQTYPFLRVYPAGDINHDDIVNFYDFAIIGDHWLEGL